MQFDIHKQYSISPTFRFTTWGLFTIIILGILASILFKTEIIVKGASRTLPRGDVWKIYAPSDGMVTEYNIFNGQQVQKGDLLLSLEDAVHEQNLRNIEQNIKEYQCLHDAYGFLLKLPDAALYEDLDQQEIKAQVDDTCVALNISLQHQQISKKLGQSRLEEIQYGTRAASLKEEQALLDDIVALSREEIKRKKSLLDQKLVSIANFESAQATHLQLRQRASELAADISEAEYLAQQAKEDQVLEISSRHYSWSMDQINLQQDINNKEISRNQEEIALRYARIYAPVDGIIDNKTINGVGDFVHGQREILSIIPSGEDLIARVDFLNRDIALIQEGQEAWLKLDAFPMERYGLVKGRVSRVSSESVLKGADWFYSVDIELDQQYIMQHEKRYDLKSGMTGQADIVVGRRRLISFLFEPITRALHEVAKEP